MKQYNCKNCGANIKHTYNHICEYCGSIIDFNEPIENVVKVDPRNLTNLQLERVEREPHTNYFIFIFTGYVIEKPRVYEVKEGYYETKEINYINPPKVHWCIRIMFEELYYVDPDIVFHKILGSGLDYRELEKVWDEIRKYIEQTRRIWFNEYKKPLV